MAVASPARTPARVSTRLTLLSVTFGLPFTAIIVWLVLSRIGAGITIAELEQRGNLYLRPLHQLIDLVPSRFLAVRGGGGEVKKIDAAIERAFRDLEEVHAVHAAKLGFTPQFLAERKRENLTPAALREHWKKVAAADPDIDAYEGVSEHVRAFISQVGDASTLILDPDLDSYYLVDATLLTLPQLQARLSKLARLGRSLKANTNPTMDLRMRVAMDMALLRESDLPRIAGDVETTLLEDDRFNGRLEKMHSELPASWKKASDAIAKFSAILEDKTSNGDDVIEASEVARAACLQFWDTCSAHLQGLLSARIHGFETERRQSLGWTVAVILLASLVAWRISVGIRQALTQVSRQLSEAVEATAATAVGAREVSQEIATSASSQASSLEETSATCVELSSLAQSNLTNAKNVTTTASQARVTAEQGAQELETLVNALRELRAEGTEVASILKAIDEIAFQTNLLALNAAVEAARAGAAGAGFAVVADEVRALAQRSASAAKETTERLGQTVAKTIRSAELAEGLKTRIDAILTDAGALDQLAAALAGSCQEESSGVGEMSKALHSIDAETQSSVSRSHRVADTAKELDEEATRLRAVVGQLSALVEKRRAPKPATAKSK